MWSILSFIHEYIFTSKPHSLLGRNTKFLSVNKICTRHRGPPSHHVQPPLTLKIINKNQWIHEYLLMYAMINHFDCINSLLFQTQSKGQYEPILIPQPLPTKTKIQWHCASVSMYWYRYVILHPSRHKIKEHKWHEFTCCVLSLILMQAHPAWK